MWQYTRDPERYLPSNLFNFYSETFSNPPWIGTAFKGATNSCAQVPDIRHYVSNHLAWLKLIDEKMDSANVSGIILTGWQRFDHYASLCELLPVSVPSLKCCLAALDKKKFDEEDAKEEFERLGIINQFAHTSLSAFPGRDLYQIIVERFGTDLINYVNGILKSYPY